MTDEDEGRITGGKWLARDTPDDSYAEDAADDEAAAADEAADTNADRPAAVHSCATRECVALLTAFLKSTRRTGTPPPPAAAGMPSRRAPLAA